MVYTYVIRSRKDNKFYTGTTSDLRKRFLEHNEGKVISTKGRGPFDLIYYEGCINIKDAFVRERYLKTGAGKRYLKNRMKRFLSVTGQAVVELAIFGTLILLIFGALLSYGQSLNYRQKLKMEAFRTALQKSYDTNRSVSYTIKRDVRQADLFSGFGFGKPSGASASASVMWQKGAAGPENSSGQLGLSYYQINDTVIELPMLEKTVTDQTGEEHDIQASVGVWSEEAKKKSLYDSTVEKKESNDSIENARSAGLEETIRTKLHTRYDSTQRDTREQPDTQPPVYVYEGELYKHYYDSLFDTGDNCACTKTETVSCDSDTGTCIKCVLYTCYTEHTVPKISPFTQGAYLTGDGSVGYNEANVGETIHKERTWQTSHD